MDERNNVTTVRRSFTLLTLIMLKSVHISDWNDQRLVWWESPVLSYWLLIKTQPHPLGLSFFFSSLIFHTFPDVFSSACFFADSFFTTNIFFLSSIMTPSHWWCVLCLQQNTVCSLSCVCAVKSLHTTTILTVSGGVEAPGTCPSSQSSELHFSLLTPDPNHAAQPNHLPQRLGLQLAPLHAGWRRNPTHLHLNNKKNGKNVP